MKNKFYLLLRKILLYRVLQNYKINKTFTDTKKNFNNYVLLEKKLQIGGSKINITYENELYEFDELDDPYSTVKSYVLQAKDSESDCVMITIDKELGISSIDNLTSVGLKCSNTLINDIGKHLIKLSIKLLQNNKEKFNIKKIIITDHSFIFCKDIKNNINLADLYTLKHGITFYGSFGFIPYDENDETNNKLKKYFYQNNKIIKELKVIDSKLLYYIEKYVKKTNYNIDELINYVKENNNNLLMNVMKVISSKKYFDKYCKVLNYIIPKLFNSNKLKSFHNLSFELLL